MSLWADGIPKRMKYWWIPFNWKSKKDMENLLEERVVLQKALNYCRVEYGFEDAVVIEALNWEPKKN